MKDLIAKYRQSINPPYSKKDYPVIGATLLILLIATTLIVILPNNYKSSQTENSNAAGKGGNNPTPTPFYAPMTVTSENYLWRWNPNKGYLCTDDQFNWSAAGSLNPGESFTFTPKNPTCVGGENAYRSAGITWNNSNLQLSTVAMLQDSNHNVINGPTIIAPNFGNSAHACVFENNLFPYTTNPFQTYNYSFTVKNVGTTTANNVQMTGESQDIWPTYYYPKCIYADADHDGWNDALEFEMYYSSQHSENTSINGLWGSDYLKAAGTAVADDEVDFYPPDFNDDGKVDQADIDRITSYLGQGNGVPLGELSPQPNDPNYSNSQWFAWRRFDLDGDGYVNQADLNIAMALIGPDPIPDANYNSEPADTISPTSRITRLSDGSTTIYTTSVPKGGRVHVGATAWDNQYLTKVEFYVNGNLLSCNQSTPNSSPYLNSLFSCWWSVPKKPGASYVIQTKAYDYSGHSGTSSNVTVNTQ